MLKALLKTMRPTQWPKNIFIAAALVFDQKMFIPSLLLKTIGGVILFCGVSSAVYIINDLADVEKDRQHPSKRLRPLASGQLDPRVALAAAVVLALACIPTSFALDTHFGIIVLAYFISLVLYSFWFKNIVILDVMTVAAGFVLRVAAGVVIVKAERFSPWMYLCMGFLALLISIGKRREELILLQENANEHRKAFDEYNLRLLEDMLGLVTTGAAVSWSFYTFSAPNLPANHTMMLTIPFVVYGLFRYLYLIHVKQEGGAPEELIFKDKPLLLDVILWGLVVVAVMYIR